MIVVDSSALIAILFADPDKEAFENVIASGERCIMSAVNAHETVTVLGLCHGAAAVEKFWQLLTDSEIEIVPFDEAQVRAAAVTFDRYGKGINPKTRPNLSGCAAYALAKTMNAPLLFKGEDFAQFARWPCFTLISPPGTFLGGIIDTGCACEEDCFPEASDDRTRSSVSCPNAP